MDIEKILEDSSKVYFTISEVADMFNVSTSLVRYWETEFTFLRPHKNSKGDRRFTKQNIEQLQLIYHLVKERGFTLEGAKNEIKENKNKIQTTSKIINRLKKIKDGLIDLKEEL